MSVCRYDVCVFSLRLWTTTMYANNLLVALETRAGFPVSTFSRQRILFFPAPFHGWFITTRSTDAVIENGFFIPKHSTRFSKKLRTTESKLHVCLFLIIFFFSFRRYANTVFLPPGFDRFRTDRCVCSRSVVARQLLRGTGDHTMQITRRTYCTSVAGKLC